MKIEYYDDHKGQALINNSKWFNRKFLKNVPIITIKGRCPIYDNWKGRISNGTLLFQNVVIVENSGGIFPLHILKMWGKEGETYQEAFDACFDEEMFQPVEKIMWYSIADYTPPEDAYILVSEDGLFDNAIELTHQEWISHPGGDSRQNAGPGWTNDIGFPVSLDMFELWTFVNQGDHKLYDLKSNNLAKYPATPDESFKLLQPNTTINVQTGKSVKPLAVGKTAKLQTSNIAQPLKIKTNVKIIN